MKFQNFTADYGAAVTAAKNDYNATDLVATQVSTYSGIYVINYYENNYGNSFAIGRTQAWSGGANNCFSSAGGITGYCNTTNKRANFAEVYLNSYYKAYIDTNTNFVVKHETGHAMGLSHPSTCNTEITVMALTGCSVRPSYLTPHDVNYLNSNY